MRYFIEMTTMNHGGIGWELGSFLWSPVGSTWNKIMKIPQRGDIVIHAVTYNGAKHFYGYSVVLKMATITENKPPDPGVWDKYVEFIKIELSSFKRFNFPPVKVQQFLNDCSEELKIIRPQRSFYNETNQIKTSQGKYLSQVSIELMEIIMNYLGIRNNYFEDYSKKMMLESDIINTNDEDEIPIVVKTEILRRIRDTKMVRSVKSSVNDQCQICGKRFKLLNGNYYSEGHHMKPLGGEYEGPDIEKNIIILCPNHHLEFDYGLIAIDNERILHADEENEFHMKEVAYNREEIIEYLEYHLKYIFNKPK